MHKSISTVLIGSLILSCSKFTFSQKKNVLFIAVDDLKPELGCYGNLIIKTPNIDRLAAKGTVFRQNYCQQAICGPTRASLMTGKRPDYTKVWDLKTLMRDVNPEILTIPQYFWNQGYITTGIGKIYDFRCIDSYSDKPSWSLGFRKTAASYFNSATGSPARNYYQLPETRKKISDYQKYFAALGITGTAQNDSVDKYIKPSVECADVPDDAYTDGANVKIANELLVNLSKNTTPFFLAVGFARPHLPFCAPKKYWDLYSRDKMPIATYQKHALNSPDIAYHNSGELQNEYTDIPPLVSFTNYKYGIGLPPDKQKELIHGYYASVSYVDAQIGKLLQTIDSLGIAENTIIVLWGDHGWHLGDHDLWCKHTNFEQATRSPLIISVPKMKPGQTVAPTEFVDIFPTLCEIAGLEIPGQLDGKSLVPLMKDPSSKVKDYAVSQYPLNGNQGYSIRTEQYRLTYWMKGAFRSTIPFSISFLNHKELYDYQTDPLETVNVINDSDYAVIAREMDKKMLEFLNTQRSLTAISQIKQVNSQNLRARKYGNTLLISHIEEGALVEIYDITGKQIAVKTSNNGEAEFNLSSPGIFIIKSGSQQMKYINN